MSTLRNIKNYVPCVRQNKGILLTDQLELEARTTANAPADDNLTDGRMFYDSTTQSVKVYAGSTWVELGTGSGSGVTSWDGMYQLDQTLAINATGTLTFAGAAALAAGDVITVTAASGVTGDCIQITNSGSGNDIQGTSNTWAVTAAGAATVTGLTLGDDESITLGASSDCTIDWDATANLLDISATPNFESDVVIATGGKLFLTGVANDADEVLDISVGDVVMGDGSLTITDGDNATSLSVTNATITTSNAVTITADAITNGSMLYLDNGNGSLNTGFYINCNDDGVSDFSVGKDGATIIATAANSTVGLTITGIQTSANAMAITTSGVTASGVASLLLNPSGNIADNGTILRIAPSGTPVAGSMAISVVGAGKDIQAFASDTDNTDEHAVIIDGSGVLSSASMLYVDNDASYATSTGQSLVNFTFTGTTTASQAFTILKVNAAKDAGGIWVDVDNTTPTAVLIDGSGVLNGGYMLQVDNDATHTTGVNQSLVYFTCTGTTSALNNTRILNVSAANDMAAIYVDVNNTTPTAVAISGSGVLNGGYMLSVDNDATLTTGVNQSIVNFTFTGTAAAKNNTRILSVSAAKDVAGIYVDVDNTTPTAVLIDGSGALTGGNMLFVDNDGAPAANTDAVVNFTFTGTATNNPIVLEVDNSTKDALPLLVTSNVASATRSVAEFIQDSTTGAISVISLKQDDVSEPWIEFVATTAGATNSVSMTDYTATGTLYMMKVMNGASPMWIPAYDSDGS